MATEKAAHERLLVEVILVDPFIADMLADEELLIIECYGSWLEGLANGALRPLTAEQAGFVHAANRRRPPESAREQAWAMYQALLQYAPGASSTSSQGS